MASNSFVHTDLHMGNIAYTKVDKKSKIKIQLDGINYLIPTYGYQYAIIDYGLIQNKKFDLKKSEEKKYQKHIKYNRDLNIFFIYTLTNVQYAIKKKNKSNKIILMNKLLNENQHLYMRIKNIIIYLYPDLNKQYNKFEKTNIVDKILYYEIVQFLAIYDKKFLATTFSKRYKPNLIPDSALEYIKLNMYMSYTNYNEIIKYLICYVHHKT